MKKLLILGGSISQIAFIKTAQKLGVFVGLVDYNPKAAAIEFADEYFQCSLLDVDAVRKVVREFVPNGISCGASDVGVLTAAKLCAEFNLPGLSIDTAIKVKDKYAMIDAFEKFNVPHPCYQLVRNITDEIKIDYPVIVKPVDNSGSRGINVAHNTSEIQNAICKSMENSYSHSVIIEEYMTGPEVSVEVLVQNGLVYVIQVTDKLTTGEPHFIEIGHSQPSQLSTDTIEKIKEIAAAATKAVGIVDGCEHIEIMVTKEGPKVIEMAGRMGGDFITTVLLPISTGVDISEYEILRALGIPKFFKYPDPVNRGAAIRFIEAKKGHVKSVLVDYIASDMKGLEELKFVCESGIEYSEAMNNNDRFGYVITSGRTAESAIRHCEKIMEHIDIKMV